MSTKTLLSAPTSKKAALKQLRNDLASREDADLSKLASRSSNATRQKTEEVGTFRTEYLRDRGRVLYSRSYRKLLNKTQSWLDPFDANVHTRLMHSQEVAHIAKTIARGLRLNEDLAEAAALGHDIGHTPFGHAGEQVLNEITGHFRHYEHSLRVVDLLENDGRGLNLTDHVRDAIVTHSKGSGPMVGGHSAPSTLEGWCVRWADPIAYLVHDIGDAVYLGELNEVDLPSESLRVLGTTASDRLTTLTADLIITNQHFAQPSSALVRAYKANPKGCTLSLSEEVGHAFEELRRYMYTAVYYSPRKQRSENKVRATLESLYEHFSSQPDLVPDYWKESAVLRGDDTMRMVTDYIASFTDREAKQVYEQAKRSRAFIVAVG